MSEDPFVTIARALASRRGPDPRRGLSCYVALGDSFTAGTGCPPGCSWADRLAEGLRREHPGLAYRNLAAEGATSAIVMKQLAEAVQLEPDLVTVVCGANDVLRSTRPDPLGYTRRLTRIVRRLRDAVPGVIVVTATAPEAWDFVELGPRTRSRIERGMHRFNRATRRVTEANHVACLDVVDHPGLRDRDNFASDGLHPSLRGHARAARAFARLLAETHQVAIADPEGDAHEPQ
jgi:lysophospholipase L1-like esterase